MIRSIVRPLIAVALVVSITVVAALPAMCQDDPVFLVKDFPDGIVQEQPTALFDEGNLYEYINGQAVFYLGYQFKRLEHGFYRRGDATFYVDVYELGSPLSAFGAYRQQKEEGTESMGVGAESAITDYLAVFHKGPYYVEIIPMDSGDDDVRDMTLVAGHAAATISGDTGLAPEIGLFPSEHRVEGSERYVDENLISYSFMGRGLVARYSLPGQEKELRLFIAMPGDDAAADTIVATYREKLSDPQTVTVAPGVPGVAGTEPYRGTTMLAKVGGSVIGCLGVEDSDAAIKLMATVAKSLGN